MRKWKMPAFFLSLLFLLNSCFFAVPAFAAEQRVFDNAGLLDEADITEIEGWCEALREDWGIDLAFLTTNGTNDMQIEQYGAEFFMQQQLGVGAAQDGVLFVMDMAERDGRILTHGKAITIYTDYYIDKMWENMVGDLSDGDYWGAFYSLYADLDYYAGEYQNYLNDPDYVSEYEQEMEGGWLIAVVPAFFIGLLVAAIRLHLLKKQMDNVKPFTDGRAYLAANGYHLQRDHSNFAGSHITKVPLAKNDNNNSSWGGSSSTFSGGGSNFGGGGGKF